MSKNQILRVPEFRELDNLRAEIEKDKRIIVHEIDRQILHILRKEREPITRARLMTVTGIARSTLYDSLTRLTVKGYVTSYSEDRKIRGRPKTYFMVVQ